VNRTACRCSSSRSTVSVQGPTGRRTVPPTRTTPVVTFPFNASSPLLTPRFWLNTRRATLSVRQRGTLAAERVAALEALDIIRHHHHHRFDIGLTRARRCQEAHGDLRVPAKYQTADGYHLGKWFQDKRRKHDLTTLPEDRREALDANNPVGFETVLAVASGEDLHATAPADALQRAVCALNDVEAELLR
jgi:hypothetical protein